MLVLLRLEINMTAIAILLVLLFNNRRNLSMMLDEKIFQVLLYVTLVSCFSDMLAWGVDGRFFSGARNLNSMSNAIYFITCVLIPYIWLLYAQFRLTEDESRLWKRNHFFAIPLLVFLFLIFINPFTGWIFYIDSQNVYHRGSLYLVQILISFFYLLYTSVFSFKKGLDSQLPSKQTECFQIASFILWPMLGAIVQVLIYGLPIVSIFIVLAELVIFINLQNRQISLDALTQINNRGQLNRYLNIRMKAERKNNNLYMLLIDIDHFKTINDTYGHKAGDQALIAMADILKTICGSYHGFVARYGGDEFAVVLECENEETIKELRKTLEKALTRFNETTTAPYRLASSIGYAQFGLPHTQDIDHLIEEADRQMYLKKKSHHS